MMKGNKIVKTMAMVLAAVAIIIGAGMSVHMTAEASKEQLMDICCPHCHGIITVNVMQDDIDCPMCHDNIHIDG